MATKRCNACQVEKGYRAFYHDNGYWSSACKACRRERGREIFQRKRATILKRQAIFRQERRQLIDDMKAKPCQDCGNQYPPYVMDFDHRVGSDKLSSVALLSLKAIPLARLLAEIAKCDLVCSNCHRERTHNRRQQPKIGPTRRKRTKP